jgi:hypothetical protein
LFPPPPERRALELAQAEVTRTRVGPAFGAALLVLFAALLSFSVIGRPFYHANDDAVMNCMADGLGWVGGEVHQTERLVFLHLLLGRSLVALYRWQAAVPWYGLLLLSSVALASAAFVYAGLRLEPDRIGAALVLAFGALVFFLGAATLHFGVTASLLAGGAVALASSLAARPAATRAHAALLAGGTFGAALLSAMLRPEGCYLGLAVASPLAWMALRRSGRRPTAAFASGLALFAAGHLALRAYETRDYGADAGWAQTFDWMRAEAPFVAHGWVWYDATSKPVFDRAGWSANDFFMLQSYFSWEPELYSAASLRRLSAQLEQAGAVHRYLPARHGLREALVNPLSMAALALTLLCCLPGSRKERAELALGFLWAAALLYGIGIALRAPPRRVYLPVWVVAMGVPVLWSCFRDSLQADLPRPSGSGRRRIAGACALAVIALAAAWEGRAARANSAFRSQRAAAAERDLVRLAPFRDSLLVNWMGAFPVQDLVRPFEAGGSQALEDARYGAFSSFWIGWPTRLPINQLWLQRHGVQDLYEALYRRDDLLMVTKPEMLPLLETFLLEHRGVTAGHRLVMAGETISVFQIFDSAHPAATERRSTPP